MAQVINTNSLSLMAQTNLNKSQASLGTAIQRLSSGLRINSAKDDAAGQAISNRFTANIEGMTQAARNANDGISLAQTTEGALNEINDNVLNIRRLTEQALNGTNSASDRKSIQEEIDARLSEIGRIAKDTEFNGVNVMDGTTSQLEIQIGAKDGQTIAINLPAMDLAKLGLDGFNVETLAGSGGAGGIASTLTKQGKLETAASVVDGVTLSDTAMEAISDAIGAADVADTSVYTYTDDKTGKTTTYAYSKTKGEATEISLTADSSDPVDNPPAVTKGDKLSTIDTDILVSGPSALKGDMTRVEAGGDVKLAAGGTLALSNKGLEAIATNLGGNAASVADIKVYASENGDYYAIHTDATSGVKTAKKMTFEDNAGELAVATGSTVVAAKDIEQIEKLANGNGKLAALDKALAQVDSFRSGLGAVQNRFNSIISNLNTTINNMTESKSRILDADFSSEVSAMSRANILQSAGITVLGQANQVPQNVLQLLR
jgi:flagellin